MTKFKPRIFISNVLLTISSYIKSLGSYIRTKEKTILVETLPLPGWFIIDDCIIFQEDYEGCGIKGFSWKTFSMPDEWVKYMDEFKSKEYRKYKESQIIIE